MSASAPTDRPPALRLPFPVHRSADDRVIAGVAGGLAERLGVDAMFVRLAFALLAVAGGAGLIAYLVLWAAAEQGPADPPPKPLPAAGATQRTVAVGLVVLGILLLLRALGLWFGDALVGPAVLGAIGSAVLWSQTDQRERWTRWSERLSDNPFDAVMSGPVSPARAVAGVLLVAGGMGWFLAANDALATARDMLLALVVSAAGLALLFGPWAARLARQLAEERRQRIRSEERAEMAAHLHDSVLHTLALIQRAESPADMVGLARSQERELRLWLYGRDAASDGESLSTALEAIAGRVERLHPVAVSLVVVGDGPVDERTRAVVQSCGEAMVNAARHSGAPAISVYAEVEPQVITAYVRDEGKGFDPEAVPADRHGIAESIKGRMERAGGAAQIASAPGEGTEVVLRLPRQAA